MRFLRETAIAALFLVLAIAMTWPLARNLGRAVHSPSDPYVSAQIIDWDLRALTSRPGELFHLPVFHPSRYALAFTEHLLGIAVVVWPFHAAGASAVTLHNIALIVGFAFCGYGAFVLGRMVTGSTLAGVVAGVFYAFIPYRFHHAPHISYVWSGWLPILLAATIWYWRRPTWRRAAAAGGAFLLNGLTCLHWLAFGSFAFAATVILAGAWSRRLLDRRWLVPMSAAVIAAIVLLAPTLVPYRTVARLYGMERSFADAQPYSGQLTDWLMPPRENALYGQWSPKEKYEPEHPLFPGFAILALVLSAALLTSRKDFRNDGPESLEAPASPRRWLLLFLNAATLAALFFAVLSAARGPVAWGPLSVSSPAVPLFLATILFLVRSWRMIRAFVEASRLPVAVWICGLWIVIGILGSLGLNGFLHESLFRLFPPFRGMRVPLRWAMVAYVGLAAFAAAGSLPALRSPRRAVRIAAAAVICAVLLFEFRPAIRWHLTADAPPVYAWLAKAKLEGAVLELPITDSALGYEYLLNQTIHHQPIVNGVSSFVPASYARLAEAARTAPIPESFIGELRSRKASLVVVHADDFYERRPVIREWLRTQLQRGQLVFLRRFDHHIAGDYVFAVAPASAELLALRQGESPDASGRTPLQSLAVFLNEDQPTFNEETFGFLGMPAAGQEARRELVVDGWALSPHGIARIDLLFENGSVRIAADRYDAPWVTRHHPWYAPGPPGFHKRIEERPRGVSKETDLEVEIVDARGHVRRLGPVPIRWSDDAGLRPDDWNREALDGLLTRLGDDPQSARELVFKRNMTLADISDRLVEQSRPATDAEFVIAVHRVIFDHDPDEKTLRRWTEKLGRGHLRVNVTDHIIGSSAFAERYLKPGVKMERVRG